MFRIFFLLLFFSSHLYSQPYVSAALHGQLGNQMFQIATATALALDHNAVAIFPDLDLKDESNLFINRKKVFWRIPQHKKMPYKRTYRDLSLCYKPIPYRDNMLLYGYFQSEKYFAHHKQTILDLFAPSEEIFQYLSSTYKELLSHPNSVAVHIRCYWPFHRQGIPDGCGALPFLGFGYFEKAMEMFPRDALFVVFSDNIPLCKRSLQTDGRNVFFIENEPHYHDLYLMSMCQHNIISNSSFSWWGAYMNRNPQKVVIAPKTWLEPHLKKNTNGLIPEAWVILE